MISTVSKVFKRSLKKVFGLWVLALLVVALGSVPAEARPFAYVANGDFSVSVIDVETNMVATIAISNARPFWVAITPDGTRAYVTARPDQVVVIDTATNTEVGRIRVQNLVHGVAITPDGTRAYVSNQQSASVSVIDTAIDSVITTIPLEGTPPPRPEGVAITPDGARVYVCNPFNHNVFVIDTATNTVMNTITMPNAPEEIAITPDGTRAYVGVGGNLVSVIDTGSNTVVDNIMVRFSPLGVAITPDGGFTYVALNDNISVIDTATNQVVATVDVTPKQRPSGIDITPDGAFAYEANGNSNSVSVIDTANNTVVATIAVARFPFGVAITPFIADLAITKTASPDPVMAGSDLTYTLTATNNGPDPSMFVNLADPLPAETTFRSLEAPPDWSCTTPNVGENGTVTCSTSRLSANATATFTLIVNVNSQVPDGTVISNTATVGARTFDPDSDNNSSTAMVTVSNPQ